MLSLSTPQLCAQHLSLPTPTPTTKFLCVPLVNFIPTYPLPGNLFFFSSFVWLLLRELKGYTLKFSKCCGHSCSFSSTYYKNYLPESQGRIKEPFVGAPQRCVDTASVVLVRFSRFCSLLAHLSFPLHHEALGSCRDRIWYPDGKMEFSWTSEIQ